MAKQRTAADEPVGETTQIGVTPENFIVFPDGQEVQQRVVDVARVQCLDCGRQKTNGS